MEQNFIKRKGLRTYTKSSQKANNTLLDEGKSKKPSAKVPLSTKDAIKYLLEGTLRLRVCRYCLGVTSELSELDEILVIGIHGSTHEVTIRDMVASFHPYKVNEDTNFPNKICTDCVNHSINCYLFAQKCEQSERALRNCFDDMYEKIDKLDSLEPIKKRGKRKRNPNYNRLYTEHNNVINYAEPIINIVNIDNFPIPSNEISELECQKCWQVLPNMESLVNHEMSHPKTMWYNCKLCGKSFIKRYLLKRHLKEHHLHANEDNIRVNMENFKCNKCGSLSITLGDHLQHMEKHKFKVMLKGLMERKVDDLCSICLEKGSRLSNLGDIISLYGGYPGLIGDRSIHNIVNATIPEMTFDSYIGTKICDVCLNNVIAAYVFIFKIKHVRNRLGMCISSTLDNLKSVDLDKNLMVEISKQTILPYFKIDTFDDLLIDNIDDKYNVEVLEDEFREKSDSDSDFGSDSILDSSVNASLTDDNESIIENPARNVSKTYMSKKLVNGYQSKYEDSVIDDICSEFLTFKKKKPVKRAPCRYTCPFCNKHFISDYFIKKHILKHVLAKVQCDTCLKQFKSKFHLFEHKKMVHVLKNESFVACNICGRTFSKAYKLKTHLKCHKIKECHLCDKVYLSQKHFDVHMQRHAVKFSVYKNNDTQTCSFCEKSFSNENELSLHVNKIHLQIKPYNCDMCDKQFYTEYNLCSHKKLHSLHSKEVCEFCNKNLKCRKDLVVHVRKHIGSKPHQCPVCRQSFYSDTKMKKHMKILHGGIFCCRLCKTVVSSHLDLNNHINVVHGSM